MILLSERYCHYHLSASRKEHFGYAPNNILRHEIIQVFLGSGRETIHFGGGKSASPDDSLFAFKKKFSKTLAPFHVGNIIVNQKMYDEACNKWERKNADKAEAYRGYFLKYRM